MTEAKVYPCMCVMFGGLGEKKNQTNQTPLMMIAAVFQAIWH